MTAPRSQKQQREHLAHELRGQSKTWVEIAEVFRVRYRLNARVALRLARGWSQRQAADEWNRRWPDDLKTLKSFSYWELWPTSTGHAPSFDSLGKLAELYECSVSFLLTDLPNYQHLDSAQQALPGTGDVPAQPAGEVVLSSPAETLFLDFLSPHAADGMTNVPSPVSWPSATSAAWRLQEITCEKLAQVIVMWAHHLNPALSRRDLLAKLSAAVTVAAAAPLFDIADPDERTNVAQVFIDASQFDEPALRYCETMVTNLRRQGDVLGPQLTLQSALGHRQMAAGLVRLAPSAYQSRALSAYAELTQLVGWLCFNAGEYRHAAHYYDDARIAAHDAENVELVTYVLCTMSHLATWQGKPRVGIDHAVAAAAWAEQTASPYARAYAADVAVRAYLASNQPEMGQTALDHEYAMVQAVQSDTPMAAWWYFYDESFFWSTHTQFALKFKQPEAALESADTSLALVDQANLHERAHRSLHRAEALIKQQGIHEASNVIGDVVGITAVNASGRVDQRIAGLRTALTPWQRSKPVRELDERLALYRASSGLSGSTNSAYSRK